jgi:hypothetical protein
MQPRLWRGSDADLRRPELTRQLSWRRRTACQSPSSTMGVQKLRES